jgi:hypothetical protein
MNNIENVILYCIFILLYITFDWSLRFCGNFQIFEEKKILFNITNSWTLIMFYNIKVQIKNTYKQETIFDIFPTFSRG